MVQGLQQSVHFMAVIEIWQKDRDWRDLLWAQLQFQNSVSQHSLAKEHRPGNTHTIRTSLVIASRTNQKWIVILDLKKMHHLVSPIENFVVVQNLLRIFSIPFQQSNQLLEVENGNVFRTPQPVKKGSRISKRRNTVKEFFIIHASHHFNIMANKEIKINNNMAKIIMAGSNRQIMLQVNDKSDVFHFRWLKM